MANKLRLNRASNDSGRRRRRANGPTFLVTLQDDTSTAQQSRHLQKTLAKKKSDLKRGTLTGTCGATQTTQGRNQTDAKKKERTNRQTRRNGFNRPRAQVREMTGSFTRSGGEAEETIKFRLDSQTTATTPHVREIDFNPIEPLDMGKIWAWLLLFFFFCCCTIYPPFSCYDYYYYKLLLLLPPPHQ